MTLAVAVLVRWLALGALAGLIGGLALEVFVLLAGDAESGSLRPRLRVWRFVCIGALLLTTAADIVMRARTMGGDGLAQSIRIVPLVLSRTHFGTIWLGRVVALAALLVVAARRGERARVLALALAAIVALSTALSGHAADWGDLSVTVLIDWAHVLAASLWIGGVVTLALVIFRIEPPLAPGSATRVCARFSRLAGWALAAVVLTGVYNAWIQLPEPSRVPGASTFASPRTRLPFRCMQSISTSRAHRCASTAGRLRSSRS